MGRVVREIDDLIGRLAYRVHRYFLQSGMPKYQLATKAGISDSNLKNINRPTFMASLKVLRQLDAVIPEDWRDEEAGGEATRPVAVPLMPDFVLGHSDWRVGISKTEKVYLDDTALGEFDDKQIGRVRRYLADRIADPDHPRESEFDLRVVRSLAPQCASHIFDVGGSDPMDFYIANWDASTGFRGGDDFTGMIYKQARDPALAHCVTRDYLVCRETGWPHLTAIRRSLDTGEKRNFLRYMLPFEGEDGRPKILSITRPQEFGSSADLLHGLVA